MFENSVLGRRATVLLVALALVLASLVALTARPAEATYPGGNGWIVFESGFDLYAIAADGSGVPIPLTVGGDAETDPRFSPDGTKIAFSRDVSGSADVFVASFDPSIPSIGVPTKVTNGGTDGEPTWSPDGTEIAFVRELTWVPLILGAPLTVTTANAAGTTLIDSGANFITAGVAPGMDVVNTTDLSTGKVQTVDSNNQLTLQTKLVGGTENDWDVGDIYTISSSNLQVWTAKSDGSTPAGTRISSSGATPTYDDTSPAWSPVSFADGNELIVYSTNRNGNFDIYAVHTNGTLPAGSLLTTGLAWDNHNLEPTWAPDGSAIAFQTPKPGNTDTNIWTLAVSVAGSGTVSTGASSNVTGAFTGSDDDDEPAWSPDGKKIAFVRGGTGGNKTYTVNADGTGGLAKVNSAATPAAHREPDWRPTVLGVNDVYAVAEGGTLTESAPGVLANDETLLASFGTVTAVEVSAPANASSFKLNADGSFNYTHDGSETTTDSFTYKPNQGSITGTLATVTINIGAVDEPPVAANDGPYGVASGGDLTKAAPGVLGNDSDPEGGGLTAVLKTGPANSASFKLNADGSFTYTHDGTDTDTDSFTYQAKDAGGNLSNVATASLKIGASSVHTTGLVDPSQGRWYLYDEDGKQMTAFFYGNPGDFPIMGDWDGDGIETPGMYRQSDGFVYLRNANSVGIADIRFYFGDPGDVPIAGDFNDDGFDTVSIYRPSNQTFYIINALGKDGGGLGAADTSYVFGNPGDKAFVGDFNGNGVETVGLHRETTGLVYYRNTHTTGNADNQFLFGDPGDRLVAGDWTGDNTFTPALFRPSNTMMFFRYTNTQGNADNQFVPSPSNATWLPVSGITK
jgi:Tol biopolymer transport system component